MSLERQRGKPTSQVIDVRTIAHAAHLLPVYGSDPVCNGHYNRTPDLGKCVMWWNVWDLARYTILDTKELDRNVTWLTKHKDTLDTSTRCEDTWLPL